jgi:hypothetical protein
VGAAAAIARRTTTDRTAADSCDRSITIRGAGIDGETGGKPK